MDIANRFNPGDAIAGLKQQRKDLATTNFNEMIDEINTTAQDEETLYGTIQKTGASITAVGAIGKGALKGFQKLKAKLSGKDTDDAETGDGETTETATETAEVEAPTEGAEVSTSAPQEIEMTTFQAGYDAPTGGATAGGEGANVGEFGGAATRQDIESEFGTQDTAPEGMEQSTYDEVISDFRGDSDVVDTAYPEDTNYLQNLDQVLRGDDTAEAPFTRTPEDTLGTQQESFEAQMRGEGDSEIGDLADEGEQVASDLGEGAETLADAATSAADAASSGLSSAIGAIRSGISSATDAASSALDTATSAVSSAVDTATTAASSAIDAATAAGTAGAEAGAAAGSAALESAGAALDATGVGAPIGLILNILGGVVLAGSMTAGIVGDVDAANEQTSATAAAQDQLKQATAGGMANIAGRYGV